MASFRMTSVSFDGSSVFLPTVKVSLKGVGDWSPKLSGLVDTGAVCTLVPVTGSFLIGKTEAEVRSGPKCQIRAANNAGVDVYRWTCDVRLWGDGNVPVDILGGTVYFCDSDMPYQILIGQHDALWGRAFAHIKLTGKPCYFTVR